MKNYLISKEDFKEMLIWEGNDGCLATDRITIDGCKIGYMYREEPNPESELPDSGWRFFQGEEDDDYVNNAENIELYALNTICNYDSDIIPYLQSPYGTAYFRNEEGVFQQEELEIPEEN